jgi:plasmid stabilization system protein ParE
MTFRVVLQPQAEEDLRAAALWMRSQSRSAATAQRWARAIRARIATLKTHPLRCPVDADSRFYGEEVRTLLFGSKAGKYRVLFVVRGKTVHVLTVRHAAQWSPDEARDQDEDQDT